ncbi:MAG TPA: tol-pal system protein YbgF [bacterium]|nr:tol-pal system protein YbgF [Myxococcales bacterium]OQA61060.1 MAG: tol-pal system protein YbgF [bacterium ADurb.Bin270]HPW44948.1 tol-pal system protein YbgF [bacterium]HQH79787.1 tol-pal system protein YbgF [bacterium]
MRKVVSFLAIPVAALISSVSFAGPLDDKIKSLDEQLQNIQRTYTSNNQNVASSIAQVEAIREDWNMMKGHVDANRHLITSQGEELSRRMDSLDHRITSIEDRMSIFSSQLSKALAKIAPEAAAEGDLYQTGLDLANESKYLEAAASFEQFLKKYPKSEFAPSALMWVGECFYSMRDYQRSIQEFQRFIEKYPRDKNTGLAIFKQGNSFYELGMTEEAKAFFNKVIQREPTSEVAAMATEKLTKIKEREAKASGIAPVGGGTGSYPGETIEQQRSRMMGTTPEPEKIPAAKPGKTVPPGKF